MLRFAGWTAGTLYPSCPMYDLFHDGRFKAAIHIDHNGRYVYVAWADGWSSEVVFKRTIGNSDRSRRRAIAVALREAR